MKQLYTKINHIIPRGVIIKSLVMIFMVSFATLRIQAQSSGYCNAGVPFYLVDLSYSPSGSFISPSDSRANNCCGTSFPDRCVEFEIYLHESSTGIKFDIYSGAVPPGAMFYQINCGPPIPVGQSVCLSGQGPHTVTFCKPGNNPNAYYIQAIPAAYSIDDDSTRMGCSVMLRGEGLKPSTVTWNDITGNGIYDSLLSCTVGCNEALFTPVPGIPSQIKYRVCGSVLDTVCDNYFPVCDTLTVTIFPEITITSPTLFRYCATSGGILINPTVGGGNGSYTYLWQDSLGNTVSTNKPYFAATGSYTFNVFDGFIDCPPASINIRVERDLPAIVDAGINETVCSGTGTIQLNGSIQLAPSGVWSGGTAPLNFPNSELNNEYNITQQDVNNGSVQFILRSVGDTVCPAYRDTVVYTITPPLVINTIVNQISCNATSDGSIIVNVSGGTAPYQYSIDGVNYQASNTFSNLSDGDFTIDVRDALGCEISTTVNIAPPMTMSSSVTVNSPVCIGNSINLSAFANGATIYNWTGPNGYNASGSNVTINNATLSRTGLYRVTISNGFCTLYDSIQVTVFAPPVANAGRDTSVCAGNIITLGGNPSATAGLAPYTYSWSPITGLSDGNVANPALVTTQSIDYVLTVTDSNGCVASDIINVTLGRCNEICTSAKGPNILGPIGSFSAPYMVPNNAAHNCLINGLNTYSQVNNIALPKPQQTTYTYTSTTGGLFPEGRYTFIKNMGDLSGPSCLHSRFHAVDHTGDGGYFMAVNGSPNLNQYGSTFFRLDSIPVCPNTNYEFSAFVTNILSGIYNQPANQFPNISFYINNVIVATSGPIPNNPGQVLNDWINAGGIWNSGNANYASIRIDNATVIATGNDLGIDDIEFSVCGPIIVDNTPLPNYCVGDVFTLSQTINSSGTSNYSFYKWQLSTDNGTNWSDASGVMGEHQSPNLYNAVIGPFTASLNMNGNIYRVLVSNDSLSLINNNGFCYAAGPPTMITVRPAPTAFAGDSSTICIGDSAVIGSLTGASGGTPPYQYSWNNGNVLNNSTIPNPTTVPVNTATYTLTVTDALGCTSIDNVTVAVSQLQVVNAVVQNVSCFGGSDGSINISISNGISPYIAHWSNGSNTEDISSLPVGNYQVTITDAIGCVINSQYTITAPTVLTISAVKTDVSCFGGSDGTINISVGGGTSPYTFNWSDGNTLEDRTNLIAGNYSVTAMDENGCTIQTSAVITQPVALSIQHTATPVSCFNGSDGSIDITASGGTAPYQYVWSNGSTLEDIHTLIANAYTVTVTDANSCTLEATITIIQPNVLAINLSTSNVSCYGYNDGQIVAAVSGGNVPYNYLWNTGDTTNVAANLIVGNYMLNILDNKGCTAAASAAITQPDSITISALIENVLCNNGNDGRIEVSASGGTAPYAYAWDNMGGSVQQNNNLTEGNYTLTVTDNNNCRNTETYYVSHPAPLQANLSGTALICIDDSRGRVMSDVSGGTAAYTYLWNTGSTASAINNLPKGTYSVTVTDAHNCITAAQFIIDEYVYSGSVQLSDNEICAGESIIFNTIINTDTTVFGIFWQFSDGVVYINNEFARTFHTAGSYTVNANIALNNGCVIRTNAPFTVYDLPVVDAGANQTICPGNNATLEATGAVNYTWSSTANFIQVSNEIIRTSPGENSVYYVTGTDARGCANTDSVQVLLHTIQPLQISNDTLLCNGTPTVLNVSGAASYQWSPSRFLSCDTCATTTVNASETIIYSVNGVDINGCTVATDTVRVFIVPMPSGSLTQSFSSCESETITLRAFPEPNVKYSWMPDTLFENNTTPVVKVSPTQTTTYVLFSTTDFGCSRLDSITVTVFPKPAWNIDDTISYCNGNSVQINLDSNLEYSWTPAYGLSCTQCANPVIQTDSNIVYAITVSTPDGCNFVDSILLNVFPLPEIEIGTGRKICTGDR
jgi:hypothetical protein